MDLPLKLHLHLQNLVTLMLLVQVKFHHCRVTLLDCGVEVVGHAAELRLEAHFEVVDEVGLELELVLFLGDGEVAVGLESGDLLPGLENGALELGFDLQRLLLLVE